MTARRHSCSRCGCPLRADDVVRFRKTELCEECLVAEWEPLRLEHYAYSGTTPLGHAIEAGPTEAIVRDIRISDYHSASLMYYSNPSMICVPWFRRRGKKN